MWGSEAWILNETPLQKSGNHSNRETMQRQNVPHSASSRQNQCVYVRTGPHRDLNLQPVRWHMYNTCSYAWLRHIRLWNSTSSAGPLTICHFPHIFSITARFPYEQRGSPRRAQLTHNSFISVCLCISEVIIFFPPNTFLAQCQNVNTVIKTMSPRIYRVHKQFGK